MKKIFFMFIAIAMFSFASYAKTLTISKFTSAPVIDGTLESGWDNIPFQVIDQDKGNFDPDYTAEFKMAYDATNIYIAIKVNDPDPYVDGASSWQSDCVELFFAIDTTGQPRTYSNGQTNAFQLRKITSKNEADGGFEGGGTLTSDVVKVAQDGYETYIQEWSIPWSELTLDYPDWTGDAGSTFMFDIQCSQAKTAATGREYQLFWNSNADNQYNTVQNQGYIVLGGNGINPGVTKNFSISKISQKPLIDGVLESEIWDLQPSFLAKEAKGDSLNKFTTEFKMCYDESNLYVGVTVEDVTPNIIGASSWQSDCVELFFAMNTQNSATYRTGDWQIRKVTAKSIEAGGLDGSSNLTDIAKSRIKVAQKDGIKYVQEWAIPWIVLMDNSTSAFNGKQFRFDIQSVQSNDPLLGKAYALFWSSNADDQWTKVTNQCYVTLNQPINVLDVVLNTLKQDIYNMSNSVNILTNKIENTNKEIESLNQNVNVLNNKVVGLKDSIIKKNAVIAALSDSIQHGKYTAYDTIKVEIYDTTKINVNVVQLDVVTKTLTLNGTDIEVSVYPNPADEVVNFKATTEISRYEIFNLNNALLHSGTVNNTEFQINLNNYSNGEYVIRIATVNGNIYSKIFIKR